MKLIYMPNWTMPFGEGFTLYKLVFIRKNAVNIPYTIAHEQCHVSQWTSIGMFRFPYLYLKELLRVGYKDNKYEIEARKYGQERPL